jgi:hypothetical protein
MNATPTRHSLVRTGPHQIHLHASKWLIETSQQCPNRDSTTRELGDEPELGNFYQIKMQNIYITINNEYVMTKRAFKGKTLLRYTKRLF